MAVKTVASGGGNFNVGSTWVGGVAPVNGDNIVVDASSGNLTLTANTVSLIGADFTGYTGTLQLSSYYINFGLAGQLGITLSATMTINRTSGYFLLGNSMTFTSNGKAVAIDTANSATITLSGTMSIINHQSTGRTTIFNGANMEFLGSNLASIPQLNLLSPYKYFIRPTGSLTIGNSSETLLSCYYVFDTINSVSLNAPIKLGSGSNLEFAQAASWTGNGVINQKPSVSFYFSSSASATLINTAGIEFWQLDIQPATTTTLTLNVPYQIKATNILAHNHNSSSTALTSSRGTINILGAGGFSASNVWIQGNFTTVAASSNPQNMISANTSLRLDSGPTYYVNNLQVIGTDVSKPGILSSYTASTTTNMYIAGGTSSFSNSQITDITNLGTSQYALTANGNILTRTSGFISSASAGGGETSATFVN